MNLKIVILFFLLGVNLYSNNHELSGKVTDGSEALIKATVQIKELKKGVYTDNNGKFTIKDLPHGIYTLQISYVGYRKYSESIEIKDDIRGLDIIMKPDYLGLEELVVSGSRFQVPVSESNVIINRIDNRIFENTQSLSMAEGINFTPGLRIENNCQNCGFTQVRMNGLDGAYSQILINSRPIFSALAGVYGLEMFPVNMIDRVEVTRGGGSALYGGNAIAGTINIITKEPTDNNYEIGTNVSAINGEALDRTIFANANVVSQDLQSGMSIYGFNKSRDFWDANGDGFSEIVKQNNTTFGLSAFHFLNDFNKIKFNLYTIDEFRRGGNKFDLQAHQADVAEQLNHRILGGDISYEHISEDLNHKFSIYSSFQNTKRDSYYGAGGRIIGVGDEISEEDELALNGYGLSDDFVTATGIQYAYNFSDDAQVIAGIEHLYNTITDEFAGYKRFINQTVNQIGTYTQFEFYANNDLTFQLGGRFEFIDIDGNYDFNVENFKQEKQLGVFVPKVTAKYDISNKTSLRTSYAEGFRAPQVFDEDLHLETVGGAARYIVFSEDLETEKSQSVNFSFSYNEVETDNQFNFVLEGFFTNLNNQFIVANPRELESGISVLTKRNSGGAVVYGANLEFNYALSRDLYFQIGGTLQEALYKEDEIIWEPEDEGDERITSTKNILRTPNIYGFYTFSWDFIEDFNFALSGIYTGSMLVPHVIDIDDEFTVLKNTPDFFEINFKLNHYVYFSDKKITLSLGVQNLLNSYQNDFDTGADRDAAYIYGPIRPRTPFFSIKYGF